MGSELNLHAGHRSRLKQQLLQNASSLSDHQLLELLLFYSIPRRDTNPIAHRLMNRFQSLSGVMNASAEELQEVSGITSHTVVLLKTLLQTMQRYQKEQSSDSRKAASIRDVADYLRPYFFASKRELVYMVSMDSTNRILGLDCLNEGSVNLAHVDYGLLMQNALRRKAAKVVLSHCHPMGIAEPSSSDLSTTEFCARLLQSVHVVLADHLIFADDQWCSMARMGYMDSMDVSLP